LNIWSKKRKKKEERKDGERNIINIRKEKSWKELFW
jgi:hypothetical protein